MSGRSEWVGVVVFVHHSYKEKLVTGTDQIRSGQVRPGQERKGKERTGSASLLRNAGDG